MRRSFRHLLFIFSTLFWCMHDAHAADSNTLKNIIIPAQSSCESLNGLNLSQIGGQGSRITSTKEVTTNNADYCVAEGHLAPEVSFKVMVPKTTWTGRYMQIGCGGLCGNINMMVGAAAGCNTYNGNGFVVAATDMGHPASEYNFGNDEQKRKDFAFRAQHLLAVSAKYITEQYYKQKPQWSYFNGCSDGGREALMEAQRYPNDFNGIIAGAAAMNFQTQNSLYHAWQAVSNTDKNGKAIITTKDLPLIHTAVVAKCDALDGQKDSIISDPQACHFDPSVLLCKAGQKDGQCLTAKQVTTLKKLYEGPKDPTTGEKLIVAGPQYGSELAWAGVFIPQTADQQAMSHMVSLQALKYLNFVKNPDANFDLKDMKFDAATFKKLSELHPLYDATNPDLSAFKAAGGKLIIWHGWADPHISPLNSIAYHNAVGQALGVDRRDQFERLYLLPGVYHCSGGEGNSLVDFLTPMMQWVEQGIAPQAITTYKANPDEHNSFGQPIGVGSDKKRGDLPALKAGEKPQMRMMGGGDKLSASTVPEGAASRPVYPYPYYAAYKGTGDVNQASSYEPKRLLVVKDQYEWMGKDFYKPYTFIQ